MGRSIPVRLAGAAIVVAAMSFEAHGQSQAPRFYPDDPLVAEPAPYPVVGPQPRALSEIIELVTNSVSSPGQRHPDTGVIAAGGVNTMGEVLDGEWFVNRHARRRLTADELLAGPGIAHPPLPGPWQVLWVRPYGSRPGILIADSREHIYLLLFDPVDHAEMSTGAQMVSSRILHAIGYHLPETYLVTFERERLSLAEGAAVVSSAGNTRALTDTDVDEFLRRVARTSRGGYRAAAIYVSNPTWRELLGPFQVYATRSDDPNDIVPHEHRRDLRGLHVVGAWINFTGMRAVGTHDVLIEEDGTPRIRHFLVDLFSTLGSGVHEAKPAPDGNDQMFDDARAAFRNVVGFGVWSPAWTRARYPSLPSVGRFESAVFDPEEWKPTERLAPFENRLPDDEYWGVRQVMAFTDEDIETMVGAGQYSDPEAAAWITRTLIERRDKIIQTYLRKVVPIDAFRIEQGRLVFDDLAARHGLASPEPSYSVHWLRLVSDTGVLVRLNLPGSFDLPSDLLSADAGSYYAARIQADGRDPALNVTVYVRVSAGGVTEVVGVERGWPGKVLVAPDYEETIPTDRYVNLRPEQRALYEPYARRDAAARGRDLTPEAHYGGQTISERTTFEAVTHALMNSTLSDADGTVLGTAFDLLAGLDRVAGQYYGAGGDQQFRLYVDLKPNAVQTLEQSAQFFEEANTVYHIGYPRSFRQQGRVPNLQISVSEDGRRADIDVDYRSSRSPQALFNGHLTAANSDVRAGDNPETHNSRWAGLISWWRDFFGSLPEGRRTTDAFGATDVDIPTPLPPDRPADASIRRPEDAVQEFLTDWLVRQNVDEAMALLSDRSYTCLNIDDEAEREALGAEGARRELAAIMREIAQGLGRRLSLTAAIEAVAPRDPRLSVVPHAFEREFAMLELTSDQAAQYVCGQPAPEDRTGYVGVLFRFKSDTDAVLGLLWVQERGQWRLVSYQVFEI